MVSVSRAFVRESDGDETLEVLPDRQISSHPNWVTAEGQALIEAEIERLQAAQTKAQASDDKQAVASIGRDLRYWLARRSSAEVKPAPEQHETVAFGSKVTIERDDARRVTYRIVGEDEADPTKGTLSFVSPLARALMGKAVGDVVSVGKGEAEIVAISV